MLQVSEYAVDTRVREVGIPASVAQRVRFLKPAERQLVELVWEGRMSRRQIARLMELPAGTVSRRVRRIGNSLYDPMVVALVHRHEGLRPDYRQIGLGYFLRHESIRDLARQHGVSRLRVQKILEHVRVWAQLTGRARGEHGARGGDSEVL